MSLQLCHVNGILEIYESTNKSQSDVLNGSIRLPIQQVGACEMGFQWVGFLATHVNGFSDVWKGKLNGLDSMFLQVQNDWN